MMRVIFLLTAISEPGDAEWQNLNDHSALLLQSVHYPKLTTHAPIQTTVINGAVVLLQQIQ